MSIYLSIFGMIAVAGIVLLEVLIVWTCSPLKIRSFLTHSAIIAFSLKQAVSLNILQWSTLPYEIVQGKILLLILFLVIAIGSAMRIIAGGMANMEMAKMRREGRQY